MHFISPELEDYVERHTEPEPELLAALNKETHQKILLPRMLSGHFQGRVLSMLSKLLRPENILEIGTFTGYATLCLCEGMPQTGVMHTIDNNEELVWLQRKYFDKSPWGKQIVQHLGNALDIIPGLETQFNLVFIDADKENYLNYFEMMVPRMKRGGIIISDNVLWSGKVLEPAKPNDKSTRTLQDYNLALKNDPRVETIVLPIRDGLTVCRVV
ncbi:MAG TPA: O-methyltransferase [Flavobacterium sp.]|jgi:predicted O-methyltransferase YrrM